MQEKPEMSSNVVLSIIQRYLDKQCRAAKMDSKTIKIRECGVFKSLNYSQRRGVSSEEEEGEVDSEVELPRRR